MNSKRKLLGGSRLASLLLALCLTLSFLPAAYAAEDRGAALLRGMTTEEKVSQMLMPSFRYWKNDEGKLGNLPEINGDVAAVLERHGFAGVVVFSQNTAENAPTARLVDAMQ
ncbi:MAG: hypothetical protein IJV64_08625, partial [Oscillospiraceae bacterium]|nr:hypothetical protein [Oscillospiraceae bacterium]